MLRARQDARRRRTRRVIAVTGELGAARAGLTLASRPDSSKARMPIRRCRRFAGRARRMAEGRFLAASAKRYGDDGLLGRVSADLPRLCAAERLRRRDRDGSGRRAGASRGGAARRGPRAFRAGGGEDFELLVAVRPRAFRYLAARFEKRFKRTLISGRRVTARTGGRVARGGARALGLGSLRGARLSAASDALRAQAARADARGAVHAAVVDPDGLQVGQPTTLRLIHRVADVIARLGSFSANFTALGHSRQIVPWGARQGKTEMLTLGKDSRWPPKTAPVKSSADRRRCDGRRPRARRDRRRRAARRRRVRRRGRIGRR